MEKITYNRKFTIAKSATQEVSLAQELYEKWGKKESYPAILKLIKTKGVQYIREEVQRLEKQGLLHFRLLCKIANGTKILWK